MSVFHVHPARLGHYAGHVRAFIGHLDHGMRIARVVHDAVKRSVPGGEMERAAKRGLSNYESVREDIRNTNLDGKWKRRE